MIRDDYFPYDREPMPSKRFRVYDPKPTHAPYGAASGTTREIWSAPASQGMSGNDAPQGTPLPSSGESRGTALTGTPPSSEFGSWVGESSLMAEVMARTASEMQTDAARGISREYV